jgi:hypothetical protein
VQFLFDYSTVINQIGSVCTQMLEQMQTEFYNSLSQFTEHGFVEAHAYKSRMEDAIVNYDAALNKIDEFSKKGKFDENKMIAVCLLYLSFLSSFPLFLLSSLSSLSSFSLPSLVSFFPLFPLFLHFLTTIQFEDELGSLKSTVVATTEDFQASMEHLDANKEFKFLRYK